MEIGLFGPQPAPIDLDSYSNVYYVSRQHGSDDSESGARTRPWKTLAHALQVADPEREGNRIAIFVAEGAYPETPVRMISGVDLYGGFETNGWERDIWRHPTLLDGELERRVVEGANDARLDGFHIVRGRTRGHGAGILCYRTSPRIFNNILQDNRTLESEGFVHDPSRRRHLGNDGGGIACVDGAHPEIAHNVIRNNGTEVGQGGGIACLNDSCPKIVYNFIDGNRTGAKDTSETRTSSGGGIFCFAGCLPILSNNWIANNTAGGRSDGGGIYLEYDSSPEIAFNYILGNKSEDDGGGLEIMKISYPKVDSNYIVGNRTAAVGGGGGLRISDRGLGDVTNNLIAANSRSGVICSNAWMSLVNNTVVHNFGNGKTFGLYFHNENWPFLAPAAIRNNLVCNNDTSEEAHIRRVPENSDSTATVANNWFENSKEAERSKDPMIDDRWLEGAVAARVLSGDRYTTQLEIEGEPLSTLELAGRPVKLGSRWSVVTAADESGFEVWGWIEDATSFAVLPTYRLLRGSPCIDGAPAEGSPSTDFEGDPRPDKEVAGARVDVGYDEFEGAKKQSVR